jgi:2,6-dihydroxypseudooxynicotine hydrolase
MTAVNREDQRADERTAAAVAHWTPRFVSNGIPLHDFTLTTGKVRAWADWCARWVEQGEIHEELADQALASGHGLTAGEHLRRAALCYHFGSFLFVEYPEEMSAAHRRSVAAYDRALPHLDPPGRRVEIPYEGSHLPAVLRVPEAPSRPPVVIMVAGLDSTKEEMGAYEEHLHRRGLATIAFDGPGQGEAQREFAIRPDFEKPVGAVVDYLRTVPEVADLFGLYGVSLGGHYVVRAAAFEPRIAACVSVSGSFRVADNWSRRPPMSRAAYRIRAHLASDEATAEFVEQLDLTGVADRVSCPLYVVAGTADRLTPHVDGIRIAEAAGGPTVLDVVEGGNHVVNNMPYRYRPQVADWLKVTLTP